ncbi:SDR family oxidoreductase [Glutamicibacter sp. PS]|uniref:SDR family NAD(P)-dependent oxidoreductase n=1 Tax=Glutamicibacter TaxID=1742989 RepID=UPI00284C7BF0|nr:SDR family oxidoreductase [Glutamicibacter sp. PS]MDR4534424.1 SDR family oxidoreductase [Glutamicibacter sp. PS]
MNPELTEHSPVALISGGGTGIGRAAAHRLRAEGYRVVLTGRRAEPLEAAAAEIDALALPGDMTDTDSTESVVRRTLETYGRIDAVLANAGGHGFSTVVDTEDSSWAASLDANLTTAFKLCRAALPHLVETGGRIVVVSSLAGIAAGPSVAGYTVGKHALIGLTRSMARDYGKRGVRVNAICPGWVRTDMADAEMDELSSAMGLPDRAAAYAKVTENVPLGRPADPEEIAGTVAFLLGRDSSYITGATLVVDGGAHMVDLPTISFDALS